MRARIGTVMGRYWAMDRDRRWDRTQARLRRDRPRRGPARRRARRRRSSWRTSRGETDEFIQPTRDRRAAARGSRARGRRDHASTSAPTGCASSCARWASRTSTEFDRGAGVRRCALTTMTRYQEDWHLPGRVRAGAARDDDRRGAGRSAATASCTSPRPRSIAHVTYFFNGGVEEPYPGEERCLVPSPRDVPTYDHKPEMSAPEAAGEFVAHWQAARRADQPFRFGIINFANADMVGHTGASRPPRGRSRRWTAASATSLEAVHETGGALIVTADHGNADEMLEPDGSPDTAHSTNPVPLIVTVPGRGAGRGRDPGRRRSRPRWSCSASRRPRP